MCERPDVYEEKVIKANKEHKCYECSTIIQQGDNYLQIKGLWDGSWRNFKMCLNCKQLRDKLQESIDCLGIGELYEELRNDGSIFYNEESDLWEVNEEVLRITSQEPFSVAFL